MNAHASAFSQFLKGISETALPPKFTRKLNRAEIVALMRKSSAEYIEYVEWLQANADRLNAEARELRALTGARHQDESSHPSDPWNIDGPHHSSRAGE